MKKIIAIVFIFFAFLSASAQKDTNDFKDKANKQYAEFMEKAWQQYNSFAGIEPPKEEPVPPVVMPEEDRNCHAKQMA